MTMTLLIVDDHQEFRTFARMMLGRDGFEVAGEARDGDSAIREVERLHPDVVLLDVQLGDGIDGFEVARRLANGSDAPRVVLTSSREASDYGTRIQESKASGFIPKRELSGEALSKLVS
jgi:two-component system, NarL family, nitrate/nitrite response regulator NarL